MRNRSRSLWFDPGHSGYRRDDDCEAEPYEPIHDSACYKIHAIRAGYTSRKHIDEKNETIATRSSHACATCRMWDEQASGASNPGG